MEWVQEAMHIHGLLYTNGYMLIHTHRYLHTYLDFFLTQSPVFFASLVVRDCEGAWCVHLFPSHDFHVTAILCVVTVLWPPHTHTYMQCWWSQLKGGLKLNDVSRSDFSRLSEWLERSLSAITHGLESCLQMPSIFVQWIYGGPCGLLSDCLAKDQLSLVLCLQEAALDGRRCKPYSCNGVRALLRVPGRSMELGLPWQWLYLTPTWSSWVTDGVWCARLLRQGAGSKRFFSAVLSCKWWPGTINWETFALEIVHVSNFRLENFSRSWLYYENLTLIQLFNTCVKGEHGGAVKTLLHSRLLCL